MILAAASTGLTVLTLIGLGLSVAGMILARQKQPGLLKDSVDHTQAERGGWLPLVIGVQSVSPVLAYISLPQQIAAARSGNNNTEYAQQGKRQNAAGAAAQSEQWEYQILHHVAVGPLSAVRNIEYNGRQLPELSGGYANNDAFIQYGNIVSFSAEPVGSLTIEWGGENGDIVSTWWNSNWSPSGTLLAEDSNFPLTMRALWDIKVGNIQQVPHIEYEIVSQAVHALKGVNGWHKKLWFDRNDVFTEEAFIAGSSFRAPGGYVIAYLSYVSSLAPNPPWKVGDVVYVTGSLAVALSQFSGSPSPSGDYYIVHQASVLPSISAASVFVAAIGIPAEDYGITIQNKTSHALPANPSDSRVYTLTQNAVDGVNPGCALDQILFAPKPWGAGIDRRFFDTTSLDFIALALGGRAQLLAGQSVENAVCNIKASGGRTALEVAAELMQDFGIVSSFAPRTGKKEFRLLRREDIAATVPSAMISRPLPECFTHHGPKKVAQYIMEFPDRDRRYRPNSFTYNDDGELVDSGAEPGTAKGTLHHITTFNYAQVAAQRRSVEELARLAPFTFHLGRDATYLQQGMTIDIESYAGPYLILAIKRSVMQDKVTLKCIRQMYQWGVDLRGLVTIQPPSALTRTGAIEWRPGIDREGEASAQAVSINTASDDIREPDDLPNAADVTADQATGATRVISALVTPDEDLLVSILEQPRLVSPEHSTVRVIFARIANNEQESGARVWVSTDGSEYTLLASELIPSGGGGTVVSGLNNTLESITDGSIIYTALGDDNPHVITVRDDEAWQSGRLWAVIGGSEIAFIDEVTDQGNGTYVIERMLRGQFGTTIQAWTAGTSLIIVKDADVRSFSHSLFTPGRTVYFRLQPVIHGIGDPVGSFTERTLALTGLQYTPLIPGNIRSKAETVDWDIGGDLELVWQYKNPEVPFGYESTTDGVRTEGTFTVKIYDDDPDTTGVLKHTAEDLEEATYYYSNVTMVDDFTSEPTELWVTVENIRGGYTSPVSKQQFTRSVSAAETPVITGTYTITCAERMPLLVDGTAGDFTITIPSAVDNDLCEIELKRDDTSGNSVTLSAATLIDGESTRLLDYPNMNLRMKAREGEWRIL